MKSSVVSMSSSPAIQDAIPISSIKVHQHHFVPSPKSTIGSDQEMKFINNVSMKKDTYLRQAPSPVVIKSSVTSISTNLPSEHSVTSMLRNYQVSPDAMLSATVNMSENEMLREGGFDIPVNSNHINSVEDGLLNAGPSSLSSNCSSLRPPSNTPYELFDEENSGEPAYNESGHDLRLSPHTLSNSSSSSTTDSFVPNMCRSTVTSNLDLIG